MAIVGLYAFLFMLGTCGNLAILTAIYQVRSLDRRSRYNTTLTYIGMLSIVDLISMLLLPVTIIDQVMGFWIFGTAVCKLFRLFEHIGKIFGTFILVCFSIDRYCRVCHPLKLTAYSMLALMFCITCVIVCPIVVFAQSKVSVVEEKTNELTRLHLFKCADNLGSQIFIFFSLTCFFFVTSLRLNLIVINFRSPYWLSVLYSLYMEIFSAPELQMPNSSFIYFMYGVHALPYINSASNFILYGLLNRQVNFSFIEKIRNGWKFLRISLFLLIIISFIFLSKYANILDERLKVS
ncbi:unnamed protein product [Thelazia callipaeda]|uniref:G_PROTEIN_RECEP_F1_2 domain-containing protein n=1 Tax=Thelazia callipaeda TaxID=103827 RepID=A0A0N5D5W0_THECL|nr:unnamed protein product [Thelazia callipaeda]